MSATDALVQIIRDAVREELRAAIPQAGHDGAQERLLTRAGVAKYLGLGTDAIDNLRAAGVLPPPINLGAEGKRPKPLWDRRDIDTVIDRIKASRVG